MKKTKRSSSTLTSEDLLIWGRSDPDPWNRLGNTAKPALVVIEFCQIEGPRPVLSIGTDGKATSLDLDAIALWLMSSESAGGNIVLLYNQQMALHALSYHCTLYDVQARAFQHPLAVAYLFTHRPTGELLERFSKRVRRLTAPLLACNRRLFLKQLEKLVALSDDLNSDMVREYYSLYHLEQIDGTAKRKIHAAAEQAQKLRSRLGMMAEALTKRPTDDVCAGHDAAVLPECLFQTATTTTTPRIADLAPCTYASFTSAMLDFLQVLGRKEADRGVLYSADTPILRFAKSSTPLKESLRRDEEVKGEETLRTCTSHLDEILYPSVVGDDLAVCGSQQRKRAVIDLVSKLEFARPKAHLNRAVTVWNKDATSCTGVFGIEAPPRSLPKDCPRVLDMNACQLHGVTYTGSFLSRLRARRSFPSDLSLLRFISSTLTNACQIVYLGKYVPLSILADSEKLSNEDQRIVASLLCEVDFSKFAALKERTNALPPTTVPIRPTVLR